MCKIIHKIQDLAYLQSWPSFTNPEKLTDSENTGKGEGAAKDHILLSF